MYKKYIIKLGEKNIGTTYLESADPPMGVVSGKVILNNVNSGFELFKNFCKKNNCKLEEKHKFIDTQTIDQLKVYNDECFEIKGISCHITGMESEGFDITILGISYPFYEQEFPHHVRKYKGE